MSAYATATVPVRGGALAVGIWSPDASPTVVAVHGITANHRAWALLAAALPGVRVVAPDLRGRGRSAELPGPWGMDQHAVDVAAVIEAYAAGPVVVVGHSMGGFVAAALIRRRPDLVAALVLLDGGVPFRLADGADLDRTVETTLGPALVRLGRTFITPAAYRDFWRAHPALHDDWGPEIEAYVDYDLIGEAPDLRSSVSATAVDQDARELYGTPDTDRVLGRYAGPVALLTVPRGLLDEPPGLYPPGTLDGLRARIEVQTVPELNHYTLLMGALGAERVAATVRSALG